MFIYFGLTIVAQLLLFTAPQVEAGCTSTDVKKFLSCFKTCWNQPLDVRTVSRVTSIANEMGHLPDQPQLYRANTLPGSVHSTENAGSSNNSASNSQTSSIKEVPWLSADLFKPEEIFNDENFRLLSK
jgi:hypothetical protein